MYIDDEAHSRSQNKDKRDSYQAVFHSSRHCTAFAWDFCMVNSSLWRKGVSDKKVSDS
jgi:hypothetical protein